MKIREYQLDKLEEARRLQQECLELHLPAPPVLSWRYDIKDGGRIIEKGIGKANSYTRNALNKLAYHVGLASHDIKSITLFTDGVISAKDTDGTIFDYPLRHYSSAHYMFFGRGAVENDFDATMVADRISTKSAVTISTFDSNTRKLITTITAIHLNNTASDIQITETGVVVFLSSSVMCLDIYDKFSQITLAPGQSLVWAYTTEVVYP